MARVFNSLVKTIGRDFSFTPISAGAPTPPPPPSGISLLGTMTYDATSFSAVKSLTDLEQYSSQLANYGLIRYNLQRAQSLGGNKTITVPFYKHTDGKLCQSAFYFDTSKPLLVGTSTSIFNYGNDDHDTMSMRADGTGFIATSNTNTWQGTFSAFRAASELATYSSSENVLGQQANNFIYGSLGHFISFPQSGAELWLNINTGQYLVPGFSAQYIPTEILSIVQQGSPTNSMWSTSDGVSSFMIGRFGQSAAAYVEIDLTNGTIYKYEMVYGQQQRSLMNGTEEDANGTALFAVNAKDAFHAMGSYSGASLDSSDVGWRFSYRFDWGNLNSWPVGNSTQSDMDIFGSIDTSGSLWFADWGHDDGGLFYKGNDNTLGIQKTNILLSDPSWVDGPDEPDAVVPSSTLTVFSPESGGPNNSLTGGWSTFITGGYGSPVFSTSNDGITLRAPWWQDAVAQSVSEINLTGATSITIRVSSSTSEPSYYYSSFNYPNNTGGYSGIAIANPSNYSFSNREIIIPVSDGGIGKIRFNVTNSESGSATLHSVVVNY